ncbi:hypothetical protein C8P68_102780 [Mucilaginibacter yixingensis]|uniref:Uncharacterized protein n=2 Tax=Mucilaginibacter yixingensis TaxID=1295612 RepID=A0A2T5JDV2_9SPHI|nr:hypothetical protein C8P68_102780 [Mucilaginibacter yixingensis]
MITKSVLLNFSLPAIICLTATNYITANRLKSSGFNTSHIHVIADRPEFDHISNLKLNNSISLIDHYRHVKSVLGKPDSITTPVDRSVSFYDQPCKLAYFKGIEFEKYGDKMVISQINFSQKNKVWLQSGKLILNYQTTISSLKNYFPKSIKKKLTVTNDDHGTQKFVTISLSVPKSDDLWVLLFNAQTGHLERVDYWMPD